MPRYIVTYDVRATNHDYKPLYDYVNQLGAAHLQNSVWLIESGVGASTLHDGIKGHMHPNDTLCVIELGTASPGWSVSGARDTGIAWLRARWP